jgi:hypothetical protein
LATLPSFVLDYSKILACVHGHSVAVAALPVHGTGSVAVAALPVHDKITLHIY